LKCDKVVLLWGGGGRETGRGAEQNGKEIRLG